MKKVFFGLIALIVTLTSCNSEYASVYKLKAATGSFKIENSEIVEFSITWEPSSEKSGFQPEDDERVKDMILSTLKGESNEFFTECTKNSITISENTFVIDQEHNNGFCK